MRKLLIGNPEALEVENFHDVFAASGVYDLTATGTWALRNAADSADLATGSMAAASAINGYRGTIPATATSGLVAGNRHYVIILLSISGAVVYRSKVLYDVAEREMQ